MKTGSAPLWIAAASMAVLVSPARADDVQVTASLDRPRVALNEQAVLNVTVAGSGNLPAPKLPDLPDFQVYNAGRAQNFTWVNGQASASTSYTFVLTPLKKGQFTIPPVRVEAGGQTAETQPLSLEVVEGEAAALPAPASGSEERRPAGRTSTGGNAALFIQSVVDKASVYVGEPVTFSFRLYNRMRIMSQPRYQPPETAGFWSEDLPPQRNYQSTAKGVPYNVTEVKTALFPTAPGKKTIGPAMLSVSVENLGADPFSPDFFMNFFGRAEEKTLRTEPITITVKPLPEPKPAGFKGAVGRYTLSSNVDKQTVEVGQTVTLTITVAGRGNIKALPDIELPVLTNFRSFPPNPATNIDKKDYQVTGSKVFRTILIPTTSGDLPIPPVSFTYFDPEAREYKTLTSRAFTIRATPSSQAGASPALPAGSQGAAPAPGIRRLADDIRHIKTPASLSAPSAPLARQAWFLVLNAMLLLALAGTAIYRLIYKLFLSDERQARFKMAAVRANKARQEAESALGRNDTRAASELLADGLHRFLADKLGVDERVVGLKDVVQTLKDRGVHTHDAEKVRNLWEMLDLYRFAPAQVRPDELRQASATFGHVIDELDKEIVWNG